MKVNNLLNPLKLLFSNYVFLYSENITEKQPGEGGAEASGCYTLQICFISVALYLLQSL